MNDKQQKLKYSNKFFFVVVVVVSSAWRDETTIQTIQEKNQPYRTTVVSKKRTTFLSFK